jgi:hypothetical protein
MSQAPDFDQLVQLAAEDSDVCNLTILGMPENHFAAVDVKAPTGETKRATIGGAVELSGKTFYMSALHTLLPDSTPINVDDDSRSEYSFDGSKTDDEDIIETSTSNFGTIDTLLEALPEGLETRIPQVELRHSTLELLDDITLPYACSIITRTGTYPGSFVFFPTGPDSVGLDYVLLDCKHQVEHDGSSRFRWPNVEPADANYFLSDSHDVYIIRSNGTRVTGKMHGTPAYTMFSGHTRFQLSYTIELENLLQKGDSGAWVYDAESQDFVGILTAGCLSSKRAHIVPAYRVFEDLHRQSESPRLQKLLQSASAIMQPSSRVNRPEPDVHVAVFEAPSAIAATSSAENEDTVESLDVLHTTHVEARHRINGPGSENWVKYHPQGTTDGVYNPWKAANEYRVRGTFVERYLSLPIIFPGERAEMDGELASAMVFSFRQVLSHARLQHLLFPGSGRVTSDLGSNPNLLPSYKQAVTLEVATRRRAVRNLPIYPTSPTTLKEIRFRNMAFTLSLIPMKWENAGLLDEALQKVPLEMIYEAAEVESQIMEATALSLTTALMPMKAAWSYQDCVILVLMRWFKESFFAWVKNPPCSKCSNPTCGLGMAVPTQDELARGANTVEAYRCTSESCGGFERFARYTDAFVLMETRRGRAGEWANCFGMLCRAMGFRVRWLWSSEDYVWLEIFSDYRKRWVSVDVCEQAFDRPLMYTKGSTRHLQMTT